ncbi:DUF805 domain-containing protein [Nocardia sp. NRRL S-836]|uniref:DUF805 domain-containing protein n=1 Tax=Nocardia sp. NRRL S-836 TaxID=1519492 RepID=UPI0009EAA170|nr:DUF805 domain-containing protein [Nocardia sp. NRRL S-836]
MTGITTAVTNGITRTFSWRGRAGRSEYWFYVLFCWAVVLGLAFTFDAFESGVVASIGGVSIMLVWFSLFSAMIRRLHDTGRSGAWVLIVFLPLIGGFWLFLVMTEPAQPHPNRFDHLAHPVDTNADHPSPE